MEQAAQRTTTYTLNWVVESDGTTKLVLTNSLLSVVSCEGNALPCHDSHTHVCCLAQLIRTKTSGTEQFSLRLTSPMLHSDILIQVSFDPSFLDLFIGGKTEVFFPLPNEKPIDYGIITPTDKKGYVVLNNPNLPVVGITIAVGNIPMEIINYTPPSNRASEKIKNEHAIKIMLLPKNSKTPRFDIKKDETVCRCTLPEEYLLKMKCNAGHVPVSVSANVAWSQMSESGCMTYMLLISSSLLQTPIYVKINHCQSFLEKFILGEIKVFFPLPIPKRMFSVEEKDISNFKFECLKGKSGFLKASIRAEKNERMLRGEIGYDCDNPLPNTYNVQRPNQVWSIFSNSWQLIRKPKPRGSDWKWDDSTASWICEIDPTTNFLKRFDRTHYSDCWPKRPTTQQ